MCSGRGSNLSLGMSAYQQITIIEEAGNPWQEKEGLTMSIMSFLHLTPPPDGGVPLGRSP